MVFTLYFSPLNIPCTVHEPRWWLQPTVDKLKHRILPMRVQYLLATGIWEQNSALFSNIVTVCSMSDLNIITLFKLYWMYCIK